MAWKHLQLKEELLQKVDETKEEFLQKIYKLSNKDKKTNFSYHLYARDVNGAKINTAFLIPEKREAVLTAFISDLLLSKDKEYDTILNFLYSKGWKKDEIPLGDSISIEIYNLPSSSPYFLKNLYLLDLLHKTELEGEKRVRSYPFQYGEPSAESKIIKLIKSQIKDYKQKIISYNTLQWKDLFDILKKDGFKCEEITHFKDLRTVDKRWRPPTDNSSPASY